MNYPGPDVPPAPSKEWSSKKIVLVVAAVFAVMLLLFGGMLTVAWMVLSDDQTVSSVDTTDEDYLELVRDELPELDEMPDEDLISTGHQICDIFDEYGSDPTTLVYAVEGFASTTNGLLTFDETAFLFGAAAVSYCPEVVDDLGGTV